MQDRRGVQDIKVAPIDLQMPIAQAQLHVRKDVLHHILRLDVFAHHWCTISMIMQSLKSLLTRAQSHAAQALIRDPSRHEAWGW